MVNIDFRCPPKLHGIIPEPVLASAGIPSWLRAMPSRVDLNVDYGVVPTAKQCPPFVDILRLGFYLPLATDLTFDGETFHWNAPELNDDEAPYPTTPLSYHHVGQMSGVPCADGVSSVVKFHNFWSIQIDLGWSILFTHPAHAANQPFETITAIVDVDRYLNTFIQIPALWRAAEPCILKKGTPIAQCIPVRRDEINVAIRAMTTDESRSFNTAVSDVLQEPGVYRRRFRAERP